MSQEVFEVSSKEVLGELNALKLAIRQADLDVSNQRKRYRAALARLKKLRDREYNLLRETGVIINGEFRG